jgi:excinuclease ABC subunit A
MRRAHRFRRFRAEFGIEKLFYRTNPFAAPPQAVAAARFACIIVTDRGNRTRREIVAEEKFIQVTGAREHNLKNVNVRIPRDQLVVITGISGSGKSSLAFDTLFAEGQRRYVESLSSYARQFLEQMEKPEVESVEGLPPTISIEQRQAGATPRSTVATTTEIYDYLRLLFARVGDPYCHECGKPITRQTAQQITDSVRSLDAGSRVMILAPLVRGRKGEYRDIFDRAKREGYVRARVDGELLEVDQPPKLNKKVAHTIEIVVDRLVIKKGLGARLQDSIETALGLGGGLVTVAVDHGGGAWADSLYSELYACVDCGTSLAELTPRMFSFNSPYGACPVCAGLGTRLEIDPELVVPDPRRTLAEGVIEAFKPGPGMPVWYASRLRRAAAEFGISRDKPFAKLHKQKRRLLLYGSTTAVENKYGAVYDGVIPILEHRFENTQSDGVKKRVMEYMSELACTTCDGARLRPESLAVKIDGKSISEWSSLSVVDAKKMFDSLKFGKEKAVISRQMLKEIRARLRFLVDVGLGYLTLDRGSGTLAGGEAQRIRLATQVGSGLVGVCYVLDEPSIGLHQRDNQKLLKTLRRLQGLGNTVIVVEHDEETIRLADHVIDLGPGAGEHGGKIVAQGTARAIEKAKASVTGQYLSGRRTIAIPAKRRPVDPGRALMVRGARLNNLKNVDASFPLGALVCVTGVSGSGKSSLVTETLYKAVAHELNRARDRGGPHDGVDGIELIDKVIEIDQSPIGRTPRSNPATYTGAFTEVRSLFARTKEAKIRGYKPGRFSFNVKGGRCEACEGQGTKRIEMHFLPDIFVKCEQCGGSRYNRETLEIRYRGKSIADVLNMTIEEAVVFFENFPKLKRVLQTLADVGMNYIRLGQASTTLSGGEAQRVKLSSELGKRATGSTFYMLDEPTTGLHFADISKLLDVLNRLVDRGNTVVIIEHNLDVIKCADWVIDLGPEGGEAGGQILGAGTPEHIATLKKSYTGQFLADILK